MLVEPGQNIVWASSTSAPAASSRRPVRGGQPPPPSAACDAIDFRVAERVLTLRELNRATLARQLLLERKRLSATAVIERLVGMQAQWPPAPYVGVWTRTTSFKRAALERELAKGAVVKATVMRQTLHLVTRRDYALMRAALSETNFPSESAQAKRLAPSMRALRRGGVQRERKRSPVSSESTGSPASTLAAPGTPRAYARMYCTITRRRFGTAVPMAASSRSRSRRIMSRSKHERRSCTATLPRSGPRRVATSSPGA